jgi:hypothetical protein
MSLGLILAAVVATAASDFECDLMSYDVLEPAKIHSATLKLEDRGELTDVALVTADVQALSGRRRGAKSYRDADGVNRLWPVSMKTEAGGTIKLDLVETSSTHQGTTTALLITKGGDFAVGNLAENDEQFVAVGMCSTKRDVSK